MVTKGRESKPHIGIYGRRNNGKSSLINCLAGQDIAIVSDHAGTTTDPVKKSFEITGFGPVILVDTAGIDDSGDLGRKRIERTLKSIDSVDLALLLVTNNLWGEDEDDLVRKFNDSDIPYIIVHGKSDIESSTADYRNKISDLTGNKVLEFSCIDKRNYDDLISLIKESIPESSWNTPALLGDLVNYGDIVILITPI